MARDDDAQILRVTVKGKEIDTTSLNDVVRRIMELLYALEGRTGASTIRDDLTVLGALTVEEGLTIGGHLLPSLNDTYDLGSGDTLNPLRWRDLNLSRNIDLNNGLLLYHETNSDVPTLAVQDNTAQLKSGLRLYADRAIPGDTYLEIKMDGITAATIDANTPVGSADIIFRCGSPSSQIGRFLGIERHLIHQVPACRVFNSANISIVTATPTALTFDSERFDNDGLHSTSSNTERITFTRAGLYLVGGGVQWDGSNTGSRELSIRLNGTTQIARDRRASAGGAGVNNPAQALSTTYSFAASDFIELVVEQTSGGNLNLLTGGNYSPEFWAVYQSEA